MVRTFPSTYRFIGMMEKFNRWMLMLHRTRKIYIDGCLITTGCRPHSMSRQHLMLACGIHTTMSSSPATIAAHTPGKSVRSMWRKNEGSACRGRGGGGQKHSRSDRSWEFDYSSRWVSGARCDGDMAGRPTDRRIRQTNGQTYKTDREKRGQSLTVHKVKDRKGGNRERRASLATGAQL